MSGDSTTWHTGLGLFDSAAGITAGIRDRSWVDAALDTTGATLDTVALAVDPLGTLFSWGVAWLMEHVHPLREALDQLAGNGGEVAAHASTWAAIALRTDQTQQMYAEALVTETSGWSGASAEAYQRHADSHLRVLRTVATAAHGIAYAVEGAGLLVSAVRGLVRDLIAQFVATLAVRLPGWLAAEGMTLGLATPAVVAQLSTLVARWVHKIQHFVRALLTSLRRLWSKLDDLTAVFTGSQTQTYALARSDPTAPVTEFRPDFPRGADFVDDGSGFSQQAADAYRRIRHSPGDTSRAAANTGIDPRIVEGMRQNLFVQQHDISLSPGRVERGYFTPDDRTAHLWDGATRGTLDLDDLAAFRSLAAHEYVENRLMEAGLPYRSAHPDAFDVDGDRIMNPHHPGAHELAPNAWRPDAPLRHWHLFGLDSSGIHLADDLANLDEVVATVLRGLNR